jgi:16S rRNA (guanine966-N2)-methyltransferase
LRKKIMQKSKTAKPSQVRIIGGMFRSRKLAFPTLPGLRPTGDRIRETLFNWLAPYIAGSSCLDLFAGSGALGIEALSRGAVQVTFIDSSPQACEALRSNLDLLDPELLSSGRARVVCANSLLWLEKQGKENRMHFNIAFVDPPFDAHLHGVSCDLLDGSGLLTPDSLIYIEASREHIAPSLPVSWQLEKNRMAGNVVYQLFERK